MSADRASTSPAMPDDPLTSAHLLAAAAIIEAEADERGIRHWTDLADRLTREAAMRAVVREESDDEPA